MKNQYYVEKLINKDGKKSFVMFENLLNLLFNLLNVNQINAEESNNV